jgi:hypothetical protein
VYYFYFDLYIYFGFPLARLKWSILLKLVRLPLQLGAGKTLGLSLLEVHARYFQDSDAGSDLVEERNFGNHARSSRYMTEDINRIPYSMYDSNA